MDVLPVDTNSVYIPLMKQLGYDPNDNSTDIETPACIGNVACAAVLEFRHHDKANQLGDLSQGAYSDWTDYRAVNPPGTVPAQASFTKPLNPEHWQPLTYTDASGSLIMQMFAGAQWCYVTPFAISRVPHPFALFAKGWEAGLSATALLSATRDVRIRGAHPCKRTQGWGTPSRGDTREKTERAGHPPTVALALTSSAQTAERPKFLDHARIEHGDSGLVVQANDSVPLFQALYALRLQYGWKVNWESAPGYSRFDLTDDTDPKWRASHPAAPGVTRPAGGSFIAILPEPKEGLDAALVRDLLTKLVEQYNKTDSPGKYTLLSDPDGDLTIAGTKVRDNGGTVQAITPLLDTRLTIPKVPRNVYDSIRSILAALESASGSKVIFAIASSSLLRQTESTIGGEEVPARVLLREALADTGQQMQYDLFFNADAPAYVLNVSPVMKQEGSTGGKLVFRPPSTKP